MLANQVVLIRGDRIADVGPSVAIPAGATIIDLSQATVMPGMIDAHVHVNTGGASLAMRAITALANAQTDLAAGFTTVLDMDSRGGFYTVELRDAINSGLVQGPRMQVVGQSLNQRATNYYNDSQSVRFYEGFTENKNVNGPWLARAAVREAKLHGVDYIKIYTTQDFAGTEHMWTPDATLVNSPSLTYEEVEAIVDEAHRLGVKVACHAYGGEGMDSCIKAGVDAPNHLLMLDDKGVKILLDKKLPYVPTVDDLIALEEPDLRDDRRPELAAQAPRAGLPEGGRRRHSDRVRLRRDLARDPARQAGEPVRLLCEVGPDPDPGAADRLSPRRPHAQLRLGEAHRQHREGQVRRHHRGVGKSGRRSLRDGAGEVRDERRHGGEERSHREHELTFVIPGPRFSLPVFGEGEVGPFAANLKKDPTLPSPKTGRERKVRS